MNNYQKKKNKKEQTMGWLRSYGPSKINPKRRFGMDPYGQQQEKKYTETTYGRFIHR